jgi:DNA-directed RNA polymerase specialized sigma24 family protein
VGRLRSPGRFCAWFCGIALNVARLWRRHVRLGVPARCQTAPRRAPAHAEAAELAGVSRVRGAVAALPECLRDAMWLFYLQVLTHWEAAAERASR